MTSLTRWIGFVSLLPFALGCARPVLFKRYAAADHQTTAQADRYAMLAGFVLDERVIEAPEFLLQLGSQGQASFIKAFSDKTESEKDFTEALARGLIVKPTHSGPGDRVRFTKQIVISIEKTDAAGPADRVARLAINLSGPTRARFVSWDKFATRYETVELGKIVYKGTDTLDLGADGGLSLPVADGKARLGYQGKSELNEELLLRQRYVGMTGTLATNTARIALESITGIDLAGNTVLDLVIEATPATSEHAVLLVQHAMANNEAADVAAADDDGNQVRTKAAVAKPDRVTIGRQFIQYPASSASIVCDLSGQYVLRRVTRNAETLVEGDDSVMFVTGEFRSQRISLVDADELATFVWTIQTPDRELVYLDPLGLAEFASYGDATAFLKLLAAGDAASLEGFQLKRGGRNGALIAPETTRQLQIYTRKIN